MNSLEKFGIGIDNYVKANEGIQLEDKKLLVIEYEYLIKLFERCRTDKELVTLQKKITLVKDVLDL